MRANKITVTIKAQALDSESVPGLIIEAYKRIENDVQRGILEMSDGDIVEWSTQSLLIEF